jgi:ribosome-binding factor A
MPRTDRINEEIRCHVSMILRKDVHDPRIGFITITRVDTSPDLKSTSIYFTAIQERGCKDDTLKGLKASKGFIRSLLANRMRVKFIPQITFINDVSESETNRIDEIIGMLHKEKEISDGPDERSEDDKR